MSLIDLRYRPSTRESLDSVLKNPVYAEYITRTDFPTRPVKTLEACIQELHTLNIETAVIAGRDIESTYDTPSTNDAVLASVAQAPDLFIGFYGFDPGKGMRSVRGFKKAIEQQGMKGASIDPGMAHCAISDARFYPLYALCCDYNVPVIMTAGLSPFMPGVTLEPMNPHHVDKVACDFPELKILMSHGGYPWVADAVAVTMRNANVFMDFSTCESKLFGAEYIRAANEYITDKVVFSSANPFVEVAKAVAKYETLPLTPECRRKLMYENARRFLGLVQ